ncbi:MAG: hypothetical protein AVDCRST_MAG68-4939, partial [uncultured Gemmatimonadetes bacterium]
ARSSAIRARHAPGPRCNPGAAAYDGAGDKVAGAAPCVNEPPASPCGGKLCATLHLFCAIAPNCYTRERWVGAAPRPPRSSSSARGVLWVEERPAPRRPCPL